MEFFIAWYSGDPYERWVFGHRLFGHTYWYLGWMLIGINVVRRRNCCGSKKSARIWQRCSSSACSSTIGMWTERFVIVVGSLYQDFLPANWGKYVPTIWDVGLYIGTLGAFFMLYLLFVKFLPVIAISEVKGATPQGDPHHPLGGAKEGQPMSDKVYGLMAEFDSPGAVLRAAEKSAAPATAAGTCSRRSRFTAWTRSWATRIPSSAGFPWRSARARSLSVVGLIWYCQRV